MAGEWENVDQFPSFRDLRHRNTADTTEEIITSLYLFIASPEHFSEHSFFTPRVVAEYLAALTAAAGDKRQQSGGRFPRSSEELQGVNDQLFCTIVLPFGPNDFPLTREAFDLSAYKLVMLVSEPAGERIGMTFFGGDFIEGVIAGSQNRSGVPVKDCSIIIDLVHGTIILPSTVDTLLGPRPLRSLSPKQTETVEAHLRIAAYSAIGSYEEAELMVQGLFHSEAEQPW